MKEIEEKWMIWKGLGKLIKILHILDTIYTQLSMVYGVGLFERQVSIIFFCQRKFDSIVPYTIWLYDTYVCVLCM